MKDPTKIIIGALFIIGSLGYMYGVAKACVISLEKQPDVTRMPAFLSNLESTNLINSAYCAFVIMIFLQ